MLGRAAAAIASLQGSCPLRRTANAHAVFASCLDENSARLAMDAEAIDARNGLCGNTLADNAHTGLASLTAWNVQSRRRAIADAAIACRRGVL